MITPIKNACNNKQYDAIRLLLEHGAHVQDAMLECLSVCRIADIDMITVLLDHGYDPNSDIVYTYGKILPLHLAISCNNTKLVKLLITYNANINISDGSWTPLEVACRYNRISIFKYLLKKGAHVDSSKDNLLNCACDSSTKHILFDYILDNKLGTPTIHTLEQTIRSNNTYCMYVLLDMGIDPNILQRGEMIRLSSRINVDNILNILGRYGATGLKTKNRGMCITRA